MRINYTMPTARDVIDYESEEKTHVVFHAVTKHDAF